MKPKIPKAVKRTTAILGILLFLVSWMFGFEPNALSAYPGHVQDLSYEEFMRISAQQNGDSILNKVITTVAYPSARIGRLVHNRFFVK